jgi:hypothetical protein
MCSVHSMKQMRPICDITCCSITLTERTAHLLKLKTPFRTILFNAANLKQ